MSNVRLEAVQRQQQKGQMRGQGESYDFLLSAPEVGFIFATTLTNRPGHSTHVQLPNHLVS